jgi:AcrR family transcriptional regulator
MTKDKISIARRIDRYHHGDLRTALKSAALDLVASKGPKGFTLKEAAQRARVSVAAPYHHFKNREALLAEIAQEGFAQLAAELELAAARSTTNSRRRLEAIGCAYVDFAVKNSSRFRVMFASEIKKQRYPTLLQSSKAAFATVIRALQDHFGEPSSKRGETIVLDVATMCWSLCHGVAMLFVDELYAEIGLHPSCDELVTAAIRALLKGYS